LNQIIGVWIKERALAAVLDACEKAGVTIGPVYSMEDIARDPQYIARGSIVPLFDPASGKTIPFPEAPIRLSATPGTVRFPGLPMGAANEVILQDLLGYTPAEIAALESSGAI
jgi:crotonobetainyl-CoA:carnitine CoA-transferase CaiB-like acyl-CoA transferase